MELKNILKIKITQAKKDKAPFVKLSIAELQEIYNQLASNAEIVKKKDEEITDLKNTQTIVNIKAPAQQELTETKSLDGGGFK